MRIFQHHPDGLIYLRDEAGTYAAPLEQFIADLSTLGATPYPGLPIGYQGRIYDGESHKLFSRDDQTGGDVPWIAGQQYLLHYPDLLALQQQRRAAAELAARPEAQPPTLEELATAKNREINVARVEAQMSFTFGGKQIASYTLARADMDGVAAYVALFGALPPGFSQTWKAMDNTYVPIPDVATFKAMYAAMAADSIAKFERAQELKAQLATVTAPEDLDAIKW